MIETTRILRYLLSRENGFNLNSIFTNSKSRLLDLHSSYSIHLFGGMVVIIRGCFMITLTKWLQKVMLIKSQSQMKNGRTIQVMVETPRIVRYMSSDLLTVIYKGVV